MSTINIEVTFDQLRKAIRKLSHDEKMELWRMLADEFDPNEIRRRAFEAIDAIRAANEGVTEDEVMADATAAVAEVRAERRARGG